MSVIGDVVGAVTRAVIRSRAPVDSMRVPVSLLSKYVVARGKGDFAKILVVRDLAMEWFVASSLGFYPINFRFLAGQYVHNLVEVEAVKAGFVVPDTMVRRVGVASVGDGSHVHVDLVGRPDFVHEGERAVVELKSGPQDTAVAFTQASMYAWMMEYGPNSDVYVCIVDYDRNGWPRVVVDSARASDFVPSYDRLVRWALEFAADLFWQIQDIEQSCSARIGDQVMTVVKMSKLIHEVLAYCPIGEEGYGCPGHEDYFSSFRLSDRLRCGGCS